MAGHKLKNGEFADDGDWEIEEKDGRLLVTAYNQGGFDCTSVWLDEVLNRLTLEQRAKLFSDFCTAPMRSVEPSDYSFCERVWAGPSSPWHIRRLSSVGRKLGGGIDTPSLCGRIEPPEGKGWDLDVAITPHHLTHACKACVVVYRSQVRT